jgi:hypothetical protein
LSIPELHDDVSLALAQLAAAANPRLPWWALLAVLVSLILTVGIVVSALLVV